METNVARLPRGRNKIARDSSGNVVLFDWYGAPAATKLVFKLLKMFALILLTQIAVLALN